MEMILEINKWTIFGILKDNKFAIGKKTLSLIFETYCTELNMKSEEKEKFNSLLLIKLKSMKDSYKKLNCTKSRNEFIGKLWEQSFEATVIIQDQERDDIDYKTRYYKSLLKIKELETKISSLNETIESLNSDLQENIESVQISDIGNHSDETSNSNKIKITSNKRANFFEQTKSRQSILIRKMKNSFKSSNVYLEKNGLDISTIILKPILASHKNRNFDLVIKKDINRLQILDNLIYFSDSYLKQDSYIHLFGIFEKNLISHFPIKSDIKERKKQLSQNYVYKHFNNGCYVEIADKLRSILILISNKIELEIKNKLKVKLFSVFFEKEKIRYIFFNIYSIIGFQTELLNQDFVFGIFTDENIDFSKNFKDIIKESLKITDFIINHKFFEFDVILDSEKNNPSYLNSFLKNSPLQEIFELKVDKKIIFQTFFERRHRIEFSKINKYLK